MPTPAFADVTSQKFRDLSPLLNISNDDFIRTTEPRHFRAAQELWRRVKERGFIYKGSYEGWYCTVDEVFVPDTQLLDGKCPTCGSAVERLEEESYFFKLSAFQDRLRDYYTQHPDFVTPPGRRNEIVVVHRRRPLGSERQPDIVHVGHSGAGRSGARHVRLVRRAHELHDGGRLRDVAAAGTFETLLAGRRASDRQGDRPPARRSTGRRS